MLLFEVYVETSEINAEKAKRLLYHHFMDKNIRTSKLFFVRLRTIQTFKDKIDAY